MWQTGDKVTYVGIFGEMRIHLIVKSVRVTGSPEYGYTVRIGVDGFEEDATRFALGWI